MVDVTAEVPKGAGLSGNQVSIMLDLVAKQMNRALAKASGELKREGLMVMSVSNVDPQFDVRLTQAKGGKMVVYGQGSILLGGKEFLEPTKDKASKIIGGAFADEKYRSSAKLPLQR